MFKKMMMLMALAFALASVAGVAATTTQQSPLPCQGCNPGGSGN